MFNARDKHAKRDRMSEGEKEKVNATVIRLTPSRAPSPPLMPFFTIAVFIAGKKSTN